MKEIVTTLTGDGRVAVPEEVRDLLGLEPHQPVAFVIENGQVRLERAAWTIDLVFDSVRALPGSPSDLDEQIRQAKAERAERAVRKLRGS